MSYQKTLNNKTSDHPNKHNYELIMFKEFMKDDNPNVEKDNQQKRNQMLVKILFFPWFILSKFFELWIIIINSISKKEKDKFRSHLIELMANPNNSTDQKGKAIKSKINLAVATKEGHIPLEEADPYTLFNELLAIRKKKLKVRLISFGIIFGLFGYYLNRPHDSLRLHKKSTSKIIICTLLFYLTFFVSYPLLVLLSVFKRLIFYAGSNQSVALHPESWIKDYDHGDTLQKFYFKTPNYYSESFKDVDFINCFVTPSSLNVDENNVKIDKNKDTIIYLHGIQSGFNSSACSHKSILDKYNVIILGYQGYNCNNQHTPSSDENIRRLASLVKQLKEYGLDMSKVSLYGDSMGTFICKSFITNNELCHDSFKSVILAAPFDLKSCADYYLNQIKEMKIMKKIYSFLVLLISDSITVFIDKLIKHALGFFFTLVTEITPNDDSYIDNTSYVCKQKQNIIAIKHQKDKVVTNESSTESLSKIFSFSACNGVAPNIVDYTLYTDGKIPEYKLVYSKDFAIHASIPIKHIDHVNVPQSTKENSKKDDNEEHETTNVPNSTKENSKKDDNEEHETTNVPNSTKENSKKDDNEEHETTNVPNSTKENSKKDDNEEHETTNVPNSTKENSKKDDNEEHETTNVPNSIKENSKKDDKEAPKTIIGHILPLKMPKEILKITDPIEFSNQMNFISSSIQKSVEVLKQTQPKISTTGLFDLIKDCKISSSI